MLVLVAHGSRDARWRESVERVVACLGAGDESPRVHLAYMDCTPPTLMDVSTRLVAEGVRTLRVLPLFLATEGHVERDVRPLVEEVRRAWPDLVVELLEPMGQQPEFREVLGLIAERVERA